MALRSALVVSALRTAALALALAAVPQVALAQPPERGAVHTFYDPIFNGTVFCDTIEAVREIATADAPDDIYASYYLTANALDEPTCMAIVPTGIVVDVVPLGVMVKNGWYFNAWAVKTRVGSAIVYALYLEHFEIVRA
jgi:hypothetical protein